MNEAEKIETALEEKLASERLLQAGASPRYARSWPIVPTGLLSGETFRAVIAKNPKRARRALERELARWENERQVQQKWKERRPK